MQQKEDTSTSDTKCRQKELIEQSGVVIKGPIDFVSEIPLEEEKVEIEIEWVAKSSQSFLKSFFYIPYYVLFAAHKFYKFPNIFKKFVKS